MVGKPKGLIGRVRRIVPRRSATILTRPTASLPLTPVVAGHYSQKSKQKLSRNSQPNQENYKPSEVENLLNSAKYFGLAPCLATSSNLNRKFVCKIFKVLFFLLMFFCVMRGLTFLKVTYMKREASATSVVSMSSTVVTIWARTSYATTFTRNTGHINELLMFLKTEPRISPAGFKTHILALGAPATSFLFSTFLSVSGVMVYKLEEWDWATVYGLYAYEIQVFFLKWSNSNVSREQIDSIEQNSVLGWLTTTVGFLTEFSGYFVDDFTLSLFILNGLIVHSATSDFCKNSRRKLDKLEVRSEDIWGIVNHFKCLQELHEKMDNAFGSLLISFHFNNCVNFLYYLDGIITGEIHAEAMALSSSLKMIFVDWLGKEASQMNGQLRDLIRENEEIFAETMGGSKLYLLVDDISRKPVGIGEGYYFVDEYFLGKFFGSVASYVLFIASNRNN